MPRFWDFVKCIEYLGRQRRRRRKLLDDLEERSGYSHLKEEALDRTMWRDGFGPVVRQTANEWSIYSTIAEKDCAHNFRIYVGKHKLDAVWKHVLFRVKCRLSGNRNNRDYLKHHKIFMSQTYLGGEKSRYPLFNNQTPYWDIFSFVFTAPLN